MITELFSAKAKIMIPVSVKYLWKNPKVNPLGWILIVFFQKQYKSLSKT